MRDFHKAKLHVDLQYLADMIETVGLSETAPIADDGAVSLSYGLALICGARAKPFVDAFPYWLEEVPAGYRSRFCACWDALEFEFGEDIVVWSDNAGTSETVRRIRSLAKEIEHFKLSS